MFDDLVQHDEIEFLICERHVIDIADMDTEIISFGNGTDVRIGLDTPAFHAELTHLQKRKARTAADIQYLLPRLGQIVSLVIGTGNPTTKTGERLLDESSLFLQRIKIDLPTGIIIAVERRQVFLRQPWRRRHVATGNAPIYRVDAGAAISVVADALDEDLHVRSACDAMLMLAAAHIVSSFRFANDLHVENARLHEKYAMRIGALIRCNGDPTSE